MGSPVREVTPIPENARAQLVRSRGQRGNVWTYARAAVVLLLSVLLAVATVVIFGRVRSPGTEEKTLERIPEHTDAPLLRGEPANAQTEVVPPRPARSVDTIPVVVEFRGAAAAGALITIYDEASGVVHAELRTDERGVGSIPVLPNESSLRIAVRPPATLPDAATMTQSYRPASQRIKLDEGRALRGTVQLDDGSPYARAIVEWKLADGPWTGVSVDSEGRFLIPHLPLEVVSLRANVVGTDIYSPTVEAHSSQQEAALVVAPGPVFTVRVVPWPNESLSMDAQLTPVGGLGGARSGSVGRSGELQFRGLQENQAYTLWIPSRDGKRLLYATGLLPRSDTLPLGTMPAEEVQGRIIGGTGALFRVAMVGEGFAVEGVVQPSGQFVIRGLPAGEWKLAVEATTVAGRVSMNRFARTGDNIDVRFEDLR